MRITTAFLFFVLAALAGVGLVLAAHFYTQTNRLTQQQAIAGPFSRLIVIESYDPSTRSIAALAPTRHIVDGERIRIQLAENARIETQAARRDRDVIIGYEPLQLASVEHIQPGMTAFIRIVIRPDGVLETDHLILTNSLIRP